MSVHFLNVDNDKQVEQHRVAADWAIDKRPDLYRPAKKPVTLRLDVDIVEWFKTQTQERGYQTEINRVLRCHIGLKEAGK